MPGHIFNGVAYTPRAVFFNEVILSLNYVVLRIPPHQGSDCQFEGFSSVGPYLSGQRLFYNHQSQPVGRPSGRIRNTGFPIFANF